ncbi:pyridoxamine 5'-phosphate oxidase [Belliella aquatica]|uniref:Pyridoxine/pyridoxamine 5'-phosphate oxidase n=1 Tax=Belliella aquatica TaxID=1323734 RepID=A0ABQ1LVT8_9BACT|nr:pyridoxamine 5'-phosphate oxidase [Belliella aquatica]MCH7405900.1 pyridoxamine 5'-phosphate oxidase [Belliella aquatica]GGC29827.1 pyridoxine/pyridoxamine 5'-phosphate oxidase [Belliella aquatica]
MKISDIRIDYALKSLDVEDVQKMPLEQFKIWFDEAIDTKVLEVNAMNLATVQNDGTPNSRIVLLKGIEDGLIFFTNYQSKKGMELAQNPNVAVTFFWAELERQVRFLGKVEKISEIDSDEYFFSRPYSSQIGAWVSPQSSEIANRDFLENKENELRENLDPKTIKRPEHWGGYRIKIHEAEFWQGRPSRLHDRILYRLEATGSWSKVRLAP